MEFKDFTDKIGQQYTITNGFLTASNTGEFIVSETFGYNTIYLNKVDQTYKVITEPGSYIAKYYRLKHSDCITLVAEWLDRNRESNFGNIYQKFSRKQWMHYYEVGMKYFFIDNGFKEVTDLQEGDCLVYECFTNVQNHIGIYINTNKILHHIPQRLSGLDTIDNSLIIGAYRYGN